MLLILSYNVFVKHSLCIRMKLFLFWIWYIDSGTFSGPSIIIPCKFTILSWYSSIDAIDFASSKRSRMLSWSISFVKKFRLADLIATLNLVYFHNYFFKAKFLMMIRKISRELVCHIILLSNLHCISMLIKAFRNHTKFSASQFFLFDNGSCIEYQFRPYPARWNWFFIRGFMFCMSRSGWKLIIKSLTFFHIRKGVDSKIVQLWMMDRQILYLSTNRTNLLIRM